MRIVFKQSTLNALQKSFFFTHGAAGSMLKAASKQNGLNTARKKDEKFPYFQKKIIEYLAQLEEKEAQAITKSFFYMIDTIVKSKFPVGTIREWKGKKYIKIAPGKWRLKYDSHSRGAKLAVAALKRKADSCKTSQELLQLVLANRDRFSDKDGKPLAFVKELSDYVSGLNDKLEKEDTGKSEDKRNEDSVQTSEKQIDKKSAPQSASKPNDISDKIAQWKKEGRKIVKDEHGLNFYEGMTPDEKIAWINSEVAVLEHDVDFLKKKIADQTPDNYTNIKNYLTNGGDPKKLSKYLGKMNKEQKRRYKQQLQDTEAEIKEYKSDIAYYEKASTGSGDDGNSNDGYPEKDYPEYKGKGQKAVDFIVKQKGGQVRGAFNRPEIGDIDVVWGKVTNQKKHEGYGLAHIIDKHGMDAVKKIGQIVEDGQLVTDESNHRISIEHNGYHLGLRQQWNGKKKIWIVTNFKKGGTTKTIRSNSNYTEETLSATSPKKGTTETSYSNSDHTGETLPETSPTSVPQPDKKSSAVMQIRAKYESAQSVTGNKKTVTLPNGTKIKCHYKLVESDAPTASHDENTYSPTKGFPTSKEGKTVNDRDYQNDKDAQESVRKIAAHFNSLALESPPIVTKDGIVVSGNNRTMSSKLAAKNGTDAAYIADLKEMIEEYGLEESDLDGFKHPRLILEIDAEHEGEYTTEEFAQFNRDTKKTMSNVEKAVKITKTLTEEKIQSLASELSRYETMGELYADAKGCQRFVAQLIDAGIIGDNEKAQYLKSDGTLNDTGKDFAETVLVGTVLNEDNIRRLDGVGGKRIRQKMVRAILPLVENKGTGKEYSFNKELNDAVDIAVSVAKNHEKYPNVETYLAQGTLFGESKPDEVTGKLAKLIHDEGEKAFATRMKNLGAGLKRSADGEMDIFLGEVETKQSLMERFLSIQKSMTDILTNLYTEEQSIRSIVAEVLQKCCG